MTAQEGDRVVVTLADETGQRTIFGVVTSADPFTGLHIEGNIVHAVTADGQVTEPDEDVRLTNVSPTLVEVVG